MELTKCCYALPTYCLIASINRANAKIQTHTCNNATYPQLTIKKALLYY